MTAVNSEMAKNIVHSRSTKTLQVEYNSGGVYNYSGVTRYRRDKVVKGQVNGSVGQSMHSLILGQFPFVQVR